MKINVLFVSIFTTAFVCLPAHAQVQNIKMAPLNPRFVSYMENTRRGIKSSVLRTADGHGLGLRPSPLDFSHLVGRANVLRAGPPRAALPSSYDLRTLGRLTSVRDQGAYGTCWAFASYASLESCLLTSLGETWNFSENNMANLSGFDYGFDGGGFSVMATAYLVRWLGPINDSTDPYPDPGGSTTNPPIKHVQRVDIIGRRPNSLANDEIKQAVQDHGALCVGMYMDDSSYNYNSTSHAYYYTNLTYANHAVAIVGWDDAYSSNNFSSVPASNGAFIVRNSWGTSWGDAGYFYVSYYDATFARDISEANYLFLNGDNTNVYSHIYQYDPLGWVSSFGYSSTNAWGANIFTVTNGGDLSAVSFYAVSTNVGYEISVYSGITAGQPVSGSLRANQTGSLTNAGYYTISLSSPISMNLEELFSVVVKFATPSYNYPIPVEYALAEYSSQATASPGQSYVSSGGSTWTDITSYYSTMNVCIKAFFAGHYSAPANFSATYGTYSDKIRLTWSGVTDVTGYSIYRGTSSSVLNASLLASTTALYYDDTSVSPGVVYYYWVKATGSSGSSDLSMTAYGYTPFLTPTGLSASQGTSIDHVQLSWSASLGATGYIIYRNSLNSSSSASEIMRVSSPAYSDSSTTPGASYYYWIKAYSIAATSSFSSVASGYRALSAPGGVSASGGTYNSGVLVSWSGVSGAVSYVVSRSTSADSSSSVNAGETAYTSFVDTSAIPGSIYYYWVKSKKWSLLSAFSGSASGWRRSMAAGNNARGDLDGDGIMDFAVYQESTGMWYARLSGSGYATVAYQLGSPGFSPVSCDYDGDGHTDPTVYYEPDGLWIVMLSAGGYAPAYAVLGGNGFKPVAGDFDGDGRADAVVYQEATGTWKALLSKSNCNLVTTVYGGPGCKPVAADYDGDGLVDPAVYYELPGNNLGQNLGFWYMALSGSGYLSYTKTTTGVGFVPVPADYDGDGKADVAIYNSASGVWSYWSSASNYPLPISFTLGGAGYTAVPADYDGDTKADIAVYHEATGQWYFLLSSQNYASSYGELGGSGYEAVGARR